MYPKYILNLLNIKVLVPILTNLLEKNTLLTKGFFYSIRCHYYDLKRLTLYLIFEKLTN